MKINKLLVAFTTIFILHIHYFAFPILVLADDLWYSGSWEYRKKITFNNSSQAENLTDFPVLVKLDSTRIDYNYTQNAGQDIRFTDSDGVTLINYEIEKWDETGSSFVWVRVPQIDASSSTDYIYIYYGNSLATDGQSTTSVWTSNYKLVQHLAESSGTGINDSTSNNNDGTKRSGTEPNSITTGQIGGAQNFDGSNDYIGATDTGFPTSANDRSVSLWFNPTTYNAACPIFTYGTEGGGKRFEVGTRTTTWLVIAVNGAAYGTTDTPNAGQWTHVVFTFTGANNSDFKMYINGAQKTTSSQTGTDKAVNTTSNGASQIGSNIARTNFCYSGSVDELRVLNTVSSASWIAAEYKSESDTFNTFGVVERKVTLYGGPPVCADISPKSVPIITSSVSGINFIQLNFNQAFDPVSHYALEYGIKSGQYIYGAYNIGGMGTTSYTVNLLSPGVTYYFRILAANGCATSPWSNEFVAKTTNGSSGKSAEVSLDAPLPSPYPSPIPSQSPKATPAETISDSEKNIFVNIYSYLIQIRSRTLSFIYSLKKTIANSFSFKWLVLKRDPLRISGVKAIKVTPTSAMIYWKTNHKSTSKVNYGVTLDYGKDVQSIEKTQDHFIEITELEPDTAYFYEVMSQNKDYAYDAHHEFTTPKLVD